MAIPIRLDDELQARIDAARGDVPRERFARTLLGEALDARQHEQPPRRERATGPGTRVPSSTAARGAVRPIPKGGKR